MGLCGVHAGYCVLFLVCPSVSSSSVCGALGSSRHIQTSNGPNADMDNLPLQAMPGDAASGSTVQECDRDITNACWDPCEHQVRLHAGSL